MHFQGDLEKRDTSIPHFTILVLSTCLRVKHLNDFEFHSKMMQNNSFNSTNTDMFYVQQSSAELSPQGKNNPGILNSTELYGAPAIEHITLSSIASPEPHLISIHSESKEPAFPYGYGRQDPIVPPGLNYLNLPANPFNIPATMEVVHPAAANFDDN